MKFAGIFVLMVLASLAAGQVRQREPLNQAEIDQLREMAQMPDKRIGLYVKFLRERAATLSQLEGDPRYTADRSAQIHDLLDDITALADEMDDNIDQFAQRQHANSGRAGDPGKNDIRKSLKDAIAMETELESKLKAMKHPPQRAETGRVGDPERAAQPGRDADPKAYAFSLDNALEGVTGSLDHARQVMAEQEERAKAQPKK